MLTIRSADKQLSVVQSVWTNNFNKSEEVNRMAQVRYGVLQGRRMIDVTTDPNMVAWYAALGYGTKVLP